MINRLPIVVIGAGPVGLAAASHLLERGETPLVLEAGMEPGSAVREWQHVRLFSPWRYNIDASAQRLLRQTGWTAPDPDALPTGRELRERYLVPLATRTPLVDRITYGAKVVAVGREGRDKMKTDARGDRPFVLKVEVGDAATWIAARAVIDAAGTWSNPNPAGAGGIAVPGEASFGASITYGIPEVMTTERARYAGKRTLVIGGGHSAMHVVLDLVDLQREAPATDITWAMRSAVDGADRFGGGDRDALPARGALGNHAREIMQSGRVQIEAPFLTREIKAGTDGEATLRVLGDPSTGTAMIPADEIIVATGFRPDLEMLREVRLDIDPVTESVGDLAPLIDPNVHSSGTVPPHGVDELSHPEENFFIAGMKSYGRAPTFLLATGYEQVRSIAAHVTGDEEAAHRIELNLPETGVCSAPTRTNGAYPSATSASGACCGPAQPVAASEATACCA